MRIYIAGHSGLVGSALTRAIDAGNEHSWIGKTHDELDILNRKSVFDYISAEKPEAIIIAAAKVGGIQANSASPVQFLSENLQIETNLMDAAHSAKIPRLLFLGSSCVYPKFAEQPINEDQLLTGVLEKTNEAYAIAKISGLKLVQAYRSQYGYRWISAMPTNIYGPRDNFDPETSHVLPALIKKFHDAKTNNEETVVLWGTGSPLREFMHSDDLAAACLFLLGHYDDDIPINIGVGKEISIKDLAVIVKEITGFNGNITWDSSKPDGTPRKLLDVSRLTQQGWAPEIQLREGIEKTYASYLSSP
jgi:GDP-L-fucose synthase